MFNNRIMYKYDTQVSRILDTYDKNPPYWDKCSNKTHLTFFKSFYIYKRLRKPLSLRFQLRDWLKFVCTSHGICVTHYDEILDWRSELMAFRKFEPVTIKLQSKHKKQLEDLASTFENDPFAVAFEIMALGYKMSQSWSDDNQCFFVTVTSTDRAKHNDAKFLVSQSDDLAEAYFMAGLKVLVICNKGDWEAHSTADNWG